MTVGEIDSILAAFKKDGNIGGGWTEDINTQLGKTASSVQASAAKIVGGFGMIAAGALAFVGASQGGGGVKGALTGAFSGALGALSAAGGIATLLGVALSPLTLGLSALGGALIGAAIGFFSGGKSAQQKATEAQQLEQLKVSVQKTAIDVVNTAIGAFQNALAFFDQLDQFTVVRRSQFGKFFKNLTLMMDYFVELSKKWSADSLGKAKALGEAMAPIVTLIASAPNALGSIGQYLGIAQSSIDQFFVDLELVFDRFAVLAAESGNKIEKNVRKFSERFLPAIDVIKGTLEAMTGMIGLKPVEDSAFDILKSSLLRFVGKIGELAEFFEKSLLKSVAFFADKVGPVVDLWKNAVDAINSMSEIKSPAEGAFTTLFAGIESAVNGMIDLSSRLSTEGLAKAQAIATASLSIFSAIKAGVEALTSLSTYKTFASEVFSAFAADFDQAINMMNDMAKRAIGFESAAVLFEGYIRSGSVHLASAFEMLKNIMLAAGSFFPGGQITIGGGEGVGGESSGFSANFSTPFVSGGSSTSNTSHTTVINLPSASITVEGDSAEGRAALAAIETLFGINTGGNALLNNFSG
jgi:hypothetical protein